MANGGELCALCTLFHCCFPAGDFNRQLMGQMMQMNQILGDVKDLLRQQVLYKGFTVKYPKLATFDRVRAEFI